MNNDQSNEEDINPTCRYCYKRPCEDLFWQEVVVISNSHDVPFDCPLLVKDKSSIRSALFDLDESAVERIAGDVWVKHNYGPRYSHGFHHKRNDIDHIVRHARLGLCAVLSRSAGFGNESYDTWGRPSSSGSGNSGVGGGGPWSGTSENKEVKQAEQSAIDPEDPEDSEAENEVPANSTAEQKEPEINLISGTWLPGTEELQFNKKCKARVNAEILKPTVKKRVTLDVFVVYDGEEEDLKYQVSAFLNDEGIAEADVTLFYGEKYYKAMQEKPEAVCQYKFKAKHSDCENEVESDLLEMPRSEKPVFRLRMEITPEDEQYQDDTFHLFSTDENKTYSKVLTVKDDMIPGDAFLDLEFTDLDATLSYSLEINPGNEGKKYFHFENMGLKELSNV